jgi:hypothetical protein
MARDLGMNPNKLGKLDNADQEPWKLGISLQSQRLDGPVVVFWPYIDDISETSTSVCHACGRIHVYPGIRESPVKLGQGSEFVVALDQ